MSHHLMADAAKPLPAKLASCLACCMLETCCAAACAATAGSYTFSRLMISLTTQAFLLLMGLHPHAVVLSDYLLANTFMDRQSDEWHLDMLIRTVSPILHWFSSSCAYISPLLETSLQACVIMLES